MRILIAHRDDLVLAGLRRALDDDEGLEIAAVTHDASALVPLVDQTNADAVLLDAEFPGIGGLEALRRLRAAHPDLMVAMSGGASSREVIDDALARGACGYIVERVSAAELGAAIRAACCSFAAGKTPDDVPEWASSLTPREADVLAAVARGLPNKAIANELRVTERTVKFHLTSVFRKLGVTNRTEAARWALTHTAVAP